MQLPPAKRTGPENAHAFLHDLLGEDVHTMRVLSLADGVVGVMHAAALGVHAIGRGLADALDLDPKHAIKQVDRLLSNRGIDVWQWFEPWVAFVVGERKEVLVALDWTEFDHDDHATIALYATTSHGRATPLVWKTVEKAKLKDRRAQYEMDVVSRLHEVLRPAVDVMLIADRGFGDPSAVHRRRRSRASHAAWGCRRGLRVRPIPQSEYRQAQNHFALQSRLALVSTDSEHA